MRAPPTDGAACLAAPRRTVWFQLGKHGSWMRTWMSGTQKNSQTYKNILSKQPNNPNTNTTEKYVSTVLRSNQ
jgi:hypothetical protein